MSTAARLAELSAALDDKTERLALAEAEGERLRLQLSSATAERNLLPTPPSVAKLSTPVFVHSLEWTSGVDFPAFENAVFVGE